MSGPRLTIQQLNRLESIVTELQSHGVEIRNADDLHIKFLDESRPGRGHDVSVLYVDGDHAAAAHIDAYGNGDSVAVGEVYFLCHPTAEIMCDGCSAELDVVAGAPN